MLFKAFFPVTTVTKLIHVRLCITDTYLRRNDQMEIATLKELQSEALSICTIFY